MKPIFNESLLQRLNSLLLPVVVAWSFSIAGGVFLSNTAMEGFVNRFEPFFEIFYFGKKFAIAEHFDGAIHSKTVTTQTLVPYPHRIKAIYRAPSGSFISISDGKETLVVPLGGTYKGVFKLIDVSDSTAIFRGYGKTYRLRLGFDDMLSRQEVVTHSIPDPLHPAGVENEVHAIAYQTVIRQMKDIQNVGKYIDISEVLKGSKITGFRVNSIAPESIFAQLGIAQGDIIQSVNNQKLESYADALTVYSQVPRLRSIQITVLRNNLPKDIVYEITR